MTLSRALRAGEDGRMKGEGLMLLKSSTYFQKKTLNAVVSEISS